MAAAVLWSRNVLKTNGLFSMKNFVGPTRMQYTERQLGLAEHARAALSPDRLDNPWQPGTPLPLRPKRPDSTRIAEIDPIECADSSAILPAASQTFPNATVIPTDGTVYMLALNDVLANLHERDDEVLLGAMMLADDLCIEAGEALYVVGYAMKSET